MIKIEHTEAVGFEHAIRGMRNSHNSWEKVLDKFIIILKHICPVTENLYLVVLTQQKKKHKQP